MIAFISAATLFAGLILFRQFVYSSKPSGLIERLSPVKRQSDLLNRLAAFIKSRLTELFEPRKRNLQILFELPDFLELLSVALSSGESIFLSLKRIASRMNGLISKELQVALKALEFGSDIESELIALSKRLPQQQLVESCNKIIVALKRGTPLASMLLNQAETVRQQVINELIKAAGKNETRMLIPLVFLILPVTVLFAVYPSLQLLNLSYL
jgi:tight adherence protein C